MVSGFFLLVGSSSSSSSSSGHVAFVDLSTSMLYTVIPHMSVVSGVYYFCYFLCLYFGKILSVQICCLCFESNRNVCWGGSSSWFFFV